MPTDKMTVAVWCQAPEKPSLILEVQVLFSASHTVPLKHGDTSRLMNVEVINPGKSCPHGAASDSMQM